MTLVSSTKGSFYIEIQNQMKAAEIAKLIGGTVDGDPNTAVYKPAKIEEGVPGTISFLANEKYEAYIYNCQSSVILVSKDFVPKEPINATETARARVFFMAKRLLSHIQFVSNFF